MPDGHLPSARIPVYSFAASRGWPYRSSLAAQRTARPAAAAPLDRLETVPARPATTPVSRIETRLAGLAGGASPLALALGAACAAALIGAPVAGATAALLHASTATAQAGTVTIGLLKLGGAIAVGLPMLVTLGRHIDTFSGLSERFENPPRPFGIEQPQRLLTGVTTLMGGAAFGAALAPMVAAGALPGAALAATAAGCMVSLGLGLHALAVASAFEGRAWTASLAAISVHNGLTTLACTFLTGTTAASAVATGVTIAALGCLVSSILGLLEAQALWRVPTPWADAHVQASPQEAWRLSHAAPGQPGYVAGTPAALGLRVEELRDKARLDDSGEVFWPGQPIVTWSNCDGVGQTVHAHAFAAALHGDLIRLTGAQLRCMEAPGFSSCGVDYLLCTWLQAEERALRVGKPQVVLVENLHHLLPAPQDIAAVEMSMLYRKLLRLLGKISASNPGRHRTVLLLTSSSTDGGHSSVQRALSPRQAVDFAPLSVLHRRQLAQAAAEKLARTLTRAGYGVSPHFYQSSAWQDQLDALSLLPIGGRLIDDAFDALRVVTIGGASGVELERALLRRCAACVERLTRDCAAASAAAAAPRAPRGRRQSRNDDLLVTLLELVQDPVAVLATATQQGKNQAAGALSAHNTLRQRLIDGVLAKFEARLQDRLFMGEGGAEAKDYVAAWNAAFDCAVRSEHAASPSTAPSPYVRDALMPSQALPSIARLYGWLRETRGPYGRTETRA